jgi:uncharacterized membrane protein YhiD involved in acid resistance|tara:strand:+ start:999 stop:1709 length:711 start_codon:yes stop_codon:yes gene_type:complete
MDTNSIQLNQSNIIDTIKFGEIYNPSEILINLIIAFFLGFIISLVYKKTHKGLSYSQSFVLTNIFVCVIVSMVIMVIGNNLARAFALVGALSIIRFRTVVKDTKDTAFIFWSLAAGMASGTGSYFLAISGTAVISMIALVLYYTNYGSIFKSEFIIQFRSRNSAKNKKNYNKIFSEYCKSSTLLNAESSGDGQSLKLSFDIVLKENKTYDEFIQKLSKVSGLSEVVAVAAKNDVDY